ncbi:MAG: ATP-binding cassette domain-containing protein [Alicyclobacillus sp.]|nr:ATP-binding cassette domain-containing protein [Alicyclobacillus sp.]
MVGARRAIRLNHRPPTQLVSPQPALPVWRRLLAHAWPFRVGFAGALALLFAGTACDVSTPLLVQRFIDHFLTPRSFPAGPLLRLAALYLSLLAASAAFNYLQLVQFQSAALRVVQHLRNNVFNHVQRLPLAFFDRTSSGALVSRITNDTEAIKDLFVNVLSTLAQNTAFLVGVFVSMFVLDARLAGFCALLVPVLVLIMVAYRRWTGPVFHLTRQKLSQLNAHLSESLQGMATIQAFVQEARFIRLFAQINQEHYAARLRTIRLNSLLLRPLVDVIYTLALIQVLGWFGLQALMGPVSVGVLFAFVNYLDRFFEPVNQMMMQLNLLQQAMVSAERVFELLDQPTADQTTPEVSPDFPALPAVHPTITRGHLVFENVSFSYDGHHNVLENISFEVLPGQTVALVGHTGSGKSTLALLLLRLYPVHSGSIYIDGWPLSSIPEAELRRQVGLVLQEPFLFAGDIQSNIRLGRPLSDEAVVRAARLVQADPFIQRLPRGYAEPLGERGATLSAGQRQLLAFARTMAGQPKILVLDEATASVDTETEEAIQTALARMRQGRTTLVIAHRLSTVEDADVILVLHRGRIVERGTHRQLLSQQGLYQTMYRLQQGTGTVRPHPVPPHP